MSTFAEKSSRVNIMHGIFFEDSELAYRQDNQAKAERRNAYNECLLHGILMPFSAKNGTFLEHSWLMIQYPSLHLAKVITSVLQFEIGRAIFHAISLPISLTYHVLGLLTRSLITCFAADSYDENETSEIEMEEMKSKASPHGRILFHS